MPFYIPILGPNIGELLSKRERDYVDALTSGRKLLGEEGREATPHQRNKLRKNMLKKLSGAIPDLTLLFTQKDLFYQWLTKESRINGRKEANLKLWTDFQNAHTRLPFKFGPGPEYSRVYRAGRSGKGSLGYWCEDLDHERRRYRVAVIKGDIWQPDFPFRGLSQRAAKNVRAAIALGIGIPKGRENAVSRTELLTAIARKSQPGPI
jgi:hypothetical protein